MARLAARPGPAFAQRVGVLPISRRKSPAVCGWSKKPAACARSDEVDERRLAQRLEHPTRPGSRPPSARGEMPTTSAKRRCSWRSPRPASAHQLGERRRGLRWPSRRSTQRSTAASRRAVVQTRSACARRTRRQRREPLAACRWQRVEHAATRVASRRRRRAARRARRGDRCSVDIGTPTNAQAPAGVKRTPSTGDRAARAQHERPRELAGEQQRRLRVPRAVVAALVVGLAAVDDQLRSGRRAAPPARRRLLRPRSSQRQWTCAASAGSGARTPRSAGSRASDPHERHRRRHDAGRGPAEGSDGRALIVCVPISLLRLADQHHHEHDRHRDHAVDHGRPEQRLDRVEFGETERNADPASRRR